MSAIVCVCPSFQQKFYYIRSYQNVTFAVQSIYGLHS